MQQCWHLERGLKGLNSQHLSPAFCSEILCFILERCFWTTISEKCRALIPLVSGVAFLTAWRLAAPPYQLTLIHMWTVSVCHCKKWNLFLRLSPDVREGAVVGGSRGMCGAPLLSWDALCSAARDWWVGQGEGKSGYCFLLSLVLF